VDRTVVNEINPLTGHSFDIGAKFGRNITQSGRPAGVAAPVFIPP